MRLGDIRGYLVVKVLYAYSNSKYDLLPESLQCLFDYAEITLRYSRTKSDIISYTGFVEDILDLIYMYDLVRYLQEEDLDAVFNSLLRIVNRNDDILIDLNDILEVGRLRLEVECAQLSESRRIWDRFRKWRYKRNDTLEKRSIFS